MSTGNETLVRIMGSFDRIERRLDALERRRSTDEMTAATVIAKMREHVAEERDVVRRVFGVIG